MGWGLGQGGWKDISQRLNLELIKPPTIRVELGNYISSVKINN